AKAGRFVQKANFEVANVKFVDANPFEGDPSAKVLTLSSPALYKYLKETNVKSNNYVAETIFRQLGGTSAFEQFLADRFSLTGDKIHFYSGSGLPTFIDGARKDNYATCSVMLDLISELKNSIEKQNKTIEDVVAVPGSDKGTFRNRIISSDYKNAFVAKTGTLMHTSTLAGAMNTQKGFSFFGIFNQSTDIPGSKIVQNSMVKSIMTEMGGPLAFNYEVEGFHTYNGDALKDFDQNSDFSSVEESLY
ncbi:MAG: D-alanyl-D-alanine carboxypeptidase, partial [Bacteriovorax sp.]